MDNNKIIRNVLVTLSLPTVMFLIMFFTTRANGVTYYGQADMWRTVFTNMGMTITMGCGLAMQLRNGRFDFSGGAVMILSGIMGAYYTLQIGGGPVLMVILCVVLSVIFSLITATVYIKTKLPIIICTIMMAMIYESLTLILAGGSGINLLNNSTLNIVGRVPYTIIILIIAAVFYQIMISKTTFGRRGSILRHGQESGVNIGINEKKNVLISYLCSGILFGLAAAVYVSQNQVDTQSNLSSTGILFSYIASVYIGMFLGKLSLEVIGIFMGSITIQFMNYGLQALGYGSGGWNNVAFGMFIMTFWILTAKSEQIDKFMTEHFSKKKKLENAE